MKTNLFLAALLLSASSYAQAVNSTNKQSLASTASVTENPSSVSTASSTTASAHTNTVEKVSANSTSVKQEGAQEIKATQNTAAASKTQVEKKKISIMQNNSGTVSANGGGKANTSTKDNKVSTDASLHTGVYVSAEPATNTAKTIASRSAKTVKASEKKAITTVSATTVRAKAKATNYVYAKPVAIKTHAQIKANGGIRIK